MMKAEIFDFLYAFPMSLFGNIGKLKTLKHDTRGIYEDTWRKTDAGIPDPELRLCNDYYAAFGENIASKTVFDNAYEYLVLTYQADTRTVSLWERILLVTLTLAEAAGTGFLLAPWISQEMSAAQIGYVGWIIAFAFAFGMLILTHFAGESAKKAVVYKNVIGDRDRNAIGRIRPIAFTAQQAVDAHDPPENRFMARALKGPRDRGSWAPTIATVAVLGLALAFIFWIRWEGIKQATTNQVVQMEKSGVGQSSANPFANMGPGSSTPLPPDVVQSQQQARDKVALEIGREQEGQGFGAAMLLSFIYIMTQSAGFLFSYKHAFVGDGEKAYKLTRGESHYETYVRTVASPYLNRAESRLAELRQYLIERIPEYAKNPAHVAFMDFYEKRQQAKFGDASTFLSSAQKTPSHSAADQTLSGGQNYDTEAFADLGEKDSSTTTLRAMALEIYAIKGAAARQVRFQELTANMGSEEKIKLFDLFNQVKEDDAKIQAIANDAFKD